MNVFEKLMFAAMAVAVSMGAVCTFFLPEPGIPDWTFLIANVLIGALTIIGCALGIYASVRK
jgi:hypothetical protein